MKRRDFAKLITAGGGLVIVPGTIGCSRGRGKTRHTLTQSGVADQNPKELSADVVIIGGGLGGCAAALGACRNGLRVILTEETDWIGGQIAQQGVPPDEHGSIETHGAPQSYRDYRDNVRSYYKRNYPMTEEARNRKYLNPGDGSVSRICHEPRVSVAVLMEMLNPYISSGKLELLTRHKASRADLQGDEVRAIEVTDQIDGHSVVLYNPVVLTPRFRFVLTPPIRSIDPLKYADQYL